MSHIRVAQGFDTIIHFVQNLLNPADSILVLVKDALGLVNFTSSYRVKCPDRGGTLHGDTVRSGVSPSLHLSPTNPIRN